MSTLKLEARGVECLWCAHLDLRAHPEQAKGGYGTCKAQNIFVAFSCARNCMDYERAEEALIAGREGWNQQRRTVP